MRIEVSGWDGTIEENIDEQEKSPIVDALGKGKLGQSDLGQWMLTRLTPEAIQRTLRQSYGRLRVCYGNSLHSDTSLQGRVSVRLIIAPSGKVLAADDAGSDLPDPRVIACVLKEYRRIEFPPSTETSTVVYPIMFSPGG